LTVRELARVFIEEKRKRRHVQVVGTVESPAAGTGLLVQVLQLGDANTRWAQTSDDVIFFGDREFPRNRTGRTAPEETKRKEANDETRDKYERE
jgi:hypothetical protein